MAQKTLVYKKARENVDRNHIHKKTKEKTLAHKTRGIFFTEGFINHLNRRGKRKKSGWKATQINFTTGV